jgi:ribonuclease Z
MLDVCLLGCGGMLPLPDRRLTAMLCRYNGKMVLVDCGEGTQVAINIAGWGFNSIDALCITHYHADHIAGLPGFLLTLGNNGREEPLTIFGPPGLKSVIKGLTIIAPQLPYEINLVELSDVSQEKNQIGEITMYSLPVDHGLTCLAYSLQVQRQGKFDVERAKKFAIPMHFWSRLQKGKTIEYEGKCFEPAMVLGRPRKGLKITYCTDTRPVDELVDFSQNSDLLISEGMYGDDKLEKAIEYKHMVFSEAARLARNSNSRELWLTHFSPSITNPDLLIDEAKIVFPNTVQGKDLMKKTFKFDEE